MTGVCLALMYLHSRWPHIVHGDLKSDNIMIETSGAEAVPRLLDFGLTRVLTRHPKPLGGTRAWVAPEVAACSADMYSFGHLVTFVCAGIRPQSSQSARIARSLCGLGEPPSPWPEGCALEPGCKPLADACLQADEAQRPTAPEAYTAFLRLPAALDLPDPGGNFRTLSEAMAPNASRGAGLGQACPAAADPPRPAAAEAPPAEVAGNAQAVASNAEALVRHANVAGTGLHGVPEAGPAAADDPTGVSGPAAHNEPSDVRHDAYCDLPVELRGAG
eukprot:CAMPEP_0179021880 /NCGR_PEP_ID=MMETSP0796-20121207/6119_1 /TAXON_ID=73915 /ORGANISM="Pyrodinium bahamense, Strain pbaha01" /LENGTH=274 /DNA_ID=CAMNT_0020717727 /DNA_START=27 /DNA_END=848 /DNA_ORIENTATION=-